MHVARAAETQTQVFVIRAPDRATEAEPKTLETVFRNSLSGSQATKITPGGHGKPQRCRQERHGPQVMLGCTLKHPSSTTALHISPPQYPMASAKERHDVIVTMRKRFQVTLRSKSRNLVASHIPDPLGQDACSAKTKPRIKYRCGCWVKGWHCTQLQRYVQQTPRPRT